MALPEIKYIETPGPQGLFSLVPSKLKTFETAFIVHVCNNVGAWGAGFVVPLGQRYPKARQSYLDWCREKGQAILGSAQIVEVIDKVPLVYVANMAAQEGTGGVRPLRYNALAACMDQVAASCKEAKNPVIFAPFFGSDLAGGNWAFIEELIMDCWIRRNIPVTICYLPGRVPQGFVVPQKEQS